MNTELCSFFGDLFTVGVKIDSLQRDAEAHRKDRNADCFFGQHFFQRLHFVDSQLHVEHNQQNGSGKDSDEQGGFKGTHKLQPQTVVEPNDGGNQQHRRCGEPPDQVRAAAGKAVFTAEQQGAVRLRAGDIGGGAELGVLRLADVAHGQNSKEPAKEAQDQDDAEHCKDHQHNRAVALGGKQIV